MTVTNTGAESIPVKISLIMTDLGSGQQILSGSSGVLNLPTGNSFFQYGDVLPVNYVVLSGNYAVDASPDGFLPPGNFSICYEISRVGETTVRLTEECTDALVESLSPPYLTMPDDLSEIDENRPVFSWLPPTPIYLLNGLSYNFRLVEVLPVQTSSDAILQNFPLVLEQNLPTANLVFPPSLQPLDTGKLYAWQVIANNNGQSVSASEIWTFRLKPGADSYVPLSDKAAFYRLKTELPAAPFICRDFLQIEYQNDIGDSVVSIEIYNEGGEGRTMVQFDEGFIPIQKGQNLISIDLSIINGINQNHQYTVEIRNSKRELWRGRFVYKPTN